MVNEPSVMFITMFVDSGQQDRFDGKTFTQQAVCTAVHTSSARTDTQTGSNR